MIEEKVLFLVLATIVLCTVSTTEVEKESNQKEQAEEISLPDFENQEIFSTGVQFIDNIKNTPENAFNLKESVKSVSVNDSSNDTKSKKFKIAQCLPNSGHSSVQLTNDTELIKLLQPDSEVTDRDTPGLCVLVLFYSKYCPFSSMAAPHYNALARAFPDIKMVAINAMMYHLFNTQNGIVGVPSLVIFHSGRPVAKFNDSEYTLEQFCKFVTKHTGIEAVEMSTVTSADFTGPVTSLPSKESDVFLGISWLFIIFCAIFYFTKSKWCTWIIEVVQSNWRESEAQANHEHTD